MIRALVLALLLGGCTVHVKTDSRAAAALGVGILALGAMSYEGEPETPPPMAPDRKVSEQDCTRPIDPTLGNLRCK